MQSKWNAEPFSLSE